MIAIAIRACTVLFVALGLWCAYASQGAIAWPNSDSYSPVATMRHDYGEPAKMRQAIRAIEDVVAEHGFVLNVPPVRLGRTELSYLRIVDDVEILITSIGKPNVLEVLVYDRLRKRTWQDIKEKVEAAMASAQ